MAALPENFIERRAVLGGKCGGVAENDSESAT
jgi:hypothetical protein